jgi:hypothetical protein
MAKYNTKYSMQVQAVQPAQVSGLTVTISPALKESTDTITGETTTTTVGTINGEFISFSTPDDSDMLLLTAVFEASVGFYFSENSPGFPDVKFSGDDLMAGFSTNYKLAGRDKNGNVTRVEVEVIFRPSRVDFKSQIKPIIIEFISKPDVIQVGEVESAGDKIIHATLFPTTCSNIEQNIDLNIRADEGAQYKVTCTANGVANIVPDFTNTQAYSEGFAGESPLVNSVRIPIPASNADLEWTVTVVPNSGTSNGPNVSVLTLSQKGLKTVTFTDNVTGISNTTFPDKVITLSHGLNANRSFYEVEDGDLNNSNRGWRQVDIVVTASSGTIAKKETTPINLTSFSTLANFQVKDLKVALTTSTTATISFKLKVPIINNDISCSIKLSDFLTNT